MSCHRLGFRILRIVFVLEGVERLVRQSIYHYRNVRSFCRLRPPAVLDDVPHPVIKALPSGRLRRSRRTLVVDSNFHDDVPIAKIGEGDLTCEYLACGQGP